MRRDYKPDSVPRNRIGQRSFSLLCMLLTAASLAGARSSDPPSVQAINTSTSITVDGYLNEPVWRDARAEACSAITETRGGDTVRN